jgi:hypothetical protein
VSSTFDPIFGCELVTHRLDRDGYAFHGKTRAHIAAWTAANGEIAPGLEVEHRCRRRNCIALHHLRLVTRSENEKLKTFAYRLKVPCPKGHDPNTNRAVTPEGGVTCRACNREAQGART